MLNTKDNINNVALQIQHQFHLYRPVYIMASSHYPNSSARDCSGNPASHHILLLLYLYSLYIQWCDADWSEKPVPPKGEVPTNSQLILYISTLKRSDLFLATLCASQLATWRQKEGGDADGGAESEEGIPPWLLGAVIPTTTPSVSEEPQSVPPTSQDGEDEFGYTPPSTVGGGQSTARIPGMFFYHPDHLGSITMLTDGHGQVLAGGDRGGKSHISYRPYGEILRTDSYGPDISKYKYTGQEEDKESGLYYYKARYYDPVIGRFAQNDTMAFPDRIQGMNRMMYVEGNPMRYGDKSGNNAHIHMFNQMIRHMVGGLKAAAKHTTAGARQIGRAIDGGARWLASGGNYSRNKGNKLQKMTYLSKTRVAHLERDTYRGIMGTLSIAAPPLALAIDPAFTIGFHITLINIPSILLSGGKIYYRAGAIIAEGGMINGVAAGPFINVEKNASEALIQHELAHVRQYNSMGGWAYMNHAIQSPIDNFYRILSGSRGPSWLERNADCRAGTNDYRGNTLHLLQFASVMKEWGIDLIYTILLIRLEVYRNVVLFPSC